MLPGPACRHSHTFHDARPTQPRIPRIRFVSETSSTLGDKGLDQCPGLPRLASPDPKGRSWHALPYRTPGQPSG